MRFITLLLFILSLSLAQTPPALLPLTASGTGIGQTNVFVTTAPWSINVQSDATAIIYLYDASLGKPLYTISNNQIIHETGTFFLYVNTNNGNWTLTVQSVPTSPTSNPSTPIMPTTPTTSTTPENNTTSTTATVTPTTSATSATDSSTDKAYTEVSQQVLDTWNDHLGYGIARYSRRPAVLNQEVCDSFAVIFYVQRTFIDAGGPIKDILNLDPDGDGYACSYNPNEVYEAPITCTEDRVWRNSFYDKKGQFRPGSCIQKQ